MCKHTVCWGVDLMFPKREADYWQDSGLRWRLFWAFHGPGLLPLRAVELRASLNPRQWWEHSLGHSSISLAVSWCPRTLISLHFNYRFLESSQFTKCLNPANTNENMVVCVVMPASPVTFPKVCSSLRRTLYHWAVMVWGDNYGSLSQIFIYSSLTTCPDIISSWWQEKVEGKGLPSQVPIALDPMTRMWWCHLAIPVAS
jgi:hypothetical protein